MYQRVLKTLSALSLVAAVTALSPAQTNEPQLSNDPSWWTVTDQYGQDILQVSDSSAAEPQLIAYAGGVSIDILASLSDLDQRLRAYEQANPLPTPMPAVPTPGTGTTPSGPTPMVTPGPTMTPSWMDSFTQFQHPTMGQCQAWRTWIEDDLPASGLDSLTAWSSDGTTFTCTDGNQLSAMAARLKNDQQQGVTDFTCDGNIWTVSSCGWVTGTSGPYAISLQVVPVANPPSSRCTCNKYDLSIGPCMNVASTYPIAAWGGGSHKNCDAPSQTLYISFDLAPTPAPTPDPTPSPPTPRGGVPSVPGTITLSSRRFYDDDVEEERAEE